MEELGQETSMHAAVAHVPTPSAGPSRRPPPAWDRRAWVVVIPLALIVIYAFIPSLANEFVLWDDDQNFLTNPYFRGLGAAQARWAWTTFRVGVYQPLAWLLFEAQYVFCELDPRGYHLTSLLFQVANAVVLYVLTVALLVRCQTDSCVESPWMCSLSAGLATALFAVHPLRVEAVAWVSCQPYLPCILFSMLAVLAYLRAFPIDSSPRPGWLVASFFLFLVALLFHALPVSLPVVLLILDVYPLRRFGKGVGRWFDASARRALLEKVPFVMTSLFFTGLAIAARPRSEFPLQHDGALVGIARACYAIWFYIEKTAAPLDLIAAYPIPRERNWLALPFSLCILATLAISAGLFLLRWRWPGLLAAWLCYLVILAPNSGLIRISEQPAADRYSYMAMLGLVAVAAAGFCQLWRIWSERRLDAAIGVIAIPLGVILGLTAMTRNQCRTWRNSETLWAHALAHEANPGPVAHNQLGIVRSSQGRYNAAKAHFSQALRLKPDYVDAHYNLGTVLAVQQKYTDAAAHLAEAIQLQPDHVGAHYNLGTVHVHLGNYDAANAQFAEMRRLDPGSADAYNASAMIMATCPEAKFRDGKRALEFATRACELTDWKNSRILSTLAAAQAEAGNFDAAVSAQKRGVELATGEGEKDDYRSRLVLYHAKRPYRDPQANVRHLRGQ